MDERIDLLVRTRRLGAGGGPTAEFRIDPSPGRAKSAAEVHDARVLLMRRPIEARDGWRASPSGYVPKKDDARNQVPIDQSEYNRITAAASKSTGTTVIGDGELWHSVSALLRLGPDGLAEPHSFGQGPGLVLAVSAVEASTMNRDRVGNYTVVERPGEAEVREPVEAA